MDDTPVDLDRLAAELLADAAAQSALRAAHTLPHPVDGLRQTVIALAAVATAAIKLAYWRAIDRTPLVERLRLSM